MAFTIGGNALNFAFYLVSAGRIRMLRTNYPAASIGDAVAQTGTIPTTASGLTGNFVFSLGGSEPFRFGDARAGRFSLSAVS